MPLTDEQRRELQAILALALGVFIALALLPIALTGPVGRGVGRFLNAYLGVGAWMLPLFSLVLGAMGFGRLKGLETVRVVVLFGGLVVLLPYWVGILAGHDLASNPPPASFDQWSVAQKAIGILPAFLVWGLTSIVGTAGAAIVGLVGLSVLTITTVGWHPLRRLVLADGRTGHAVVGETEEDGALQLRVEQPAADVPESRGKARKKKTKRATPQQSSEPARPVESTREEQAFITGEAIEPFGFDLLEEPDLGDSAEDEAELTRLGEVLIDTLKTFRVDAELGPNRSTGPVVTQFEVAPAPGVKVGKIAALEDDLALKMEAKSIRIVAPIPGKSYVGVEVPNPTARMVYLSELLEPPAWNPAQSGLPIALGRDLEGEPVIADLTKMPHLLIAGATGSGKSVCINTIVTSLIHRYTERELRMLMIDPKMVELTAYNALPHLIHPVVTNNKDAAKALKWAMWEMEERYALFSVNNARNLHEFNRKVKEGKEVVAPAEDGNQGDEDDETLTLPGMPRTVPYDGSTLPFVVVVVDELADLMMTVQAEVEKPLAILAQKARATGIHLILATQRPSVNVITGLIKANFPSRIAFRVASKVDSRTILDQNGAEALLGNGDMLFLPPGKSEPRRVQGAFISSDETETICGYYLDERTRLRDEMEKHGNVAIEEEDILAKVREREAREEGGPEGEGPAGGAGERDPLFREAAEICLAEGGGSTSLLQRKMRIGYGRAARIVDQLVDAGILGGQDSGAKKRDVLIGAHQLEDLCR